MQGFNEFVGLTRKQPSPKGKAINSQPYKIGQKIIYKGITYLIVDVYKSFITVTDDSGWTRKLIYKCCYNDIKMQVIK